MSFKTNPSTQDYEPTDLLPQHLAHKPVYALPYEYFDSAFYPDGTDIRYISIGLAQYDQDDVSVKTMRHTGTKWTRQAEELPIHRPVDMTIFLAKSVFDVSNGTVCFPQGTFEGQSSDVILSPEQRSYGEMASYNAFLDGREQLLKDRLNTLRNTLNDLANRGKI